jgi:putative hemolysin
VQEEYSQLSRNFAQNEVRGQTVSNLTEASAAPFALDTSKAKEAIRKVLSTTPFKVLTPLFERWLEEQLSRIPDGIQGDEFSDRVLERLEIGYDCKKEDLDRISASGPLLVVANHPFGLVEGLILTTVVSKVRPDVKMLANSLLASVAGLDRWIIPVNPFGGADAVRENRRPLRQSVSWLRSGGALIVFPAGEVATLQVPTLVITDPEWNTNIARLSRLTNASVLPVFVHGANSPAFHVAGLIHPRLRTVLLPHEFFNKAGTNIQLSIGSVIPAARIAAASNPTAYVRGRTLALEARAQKASTRHRFLYSKPARIAGAGDPKPIAEEIQSLPPHQLLHEEREYAVFFATAAQIPLALKEIGRLREIAFRQTGEGTGKAADLDTFDRYYYHLLVWNQQGREIVGAYRLAKTDEIISSLGVRGLYTNTLFRLTPGFYRRLQPALELGRSFIRLEHQKGFLPLFLLWKGIGRFVARNPRYRVLFGPVSISRNYTWLSRALIVSYVKSTCSNHELAPYSKPRNPFRTARFGAVDPRNFGSLLSDLEELAEIVTDIEPDGKKLPVLLRHYLNLGARIIDFNVDRRFSDVLDGLVVLDLANVGRRQLERYMGADNAASFLREHTANSPVQDVA